MKSSIKKIIIAVIILLPIILLAMYTVATNRAGGKKNTITEGTIVNRLPSEIIDEIAQSIEEEDFETAFVKIEETLKDPNIPTSRGVPLLVLAAQKDSYDLAAILLAKGSDSNQPDANTGETALIKAARNGNLNLMNLLLIANADPNAQSRRGVTVLTAAIQNGNPQLTEFLLSRGARAGSTPENLLNYAFQKKFVGVDAMLKTGVDPNSRDKNGNTALIIAASYGDIQSAQALITYKANVNAANSTGMTPLLYAIQTQNKEMTELLLEKGADVNKTNLNNEGPLFWAAYFGNTRLVEDLLKLGADYNKATNKNLTALQIAERNKKADTAKLIKDFIAYKNIPRDEKGRPIIPKAATVKQQPAQQPAQAAPPAAALAQPQAGAKPPAQGAATGAKPAAGTQAAAQQQKVKKTNVEDLPPQAIPGMPPGFNPAAAMGAAGVPPGAIPPGALPPGMMPTGQMPPDALPPGMQQPQQEPRKIGNTEVGKLRTSSL